MDGNCLILFADSDFKLESESIVGDNIANILMMKALPNGSHWRQLAGGRSIAFFSLIDAQYALSYSLITENIDIPIISFIILGNYIEMARILQRQLIGIQSAYFRRCSRFSKLDKIQTSLLVQNILSLRISSLPFENDLKKKKKIMTNYRSANEWIDVEQSLLALASANMRALANFRTLTLQIEEEFDLLGVVQSA